MTACGTAIAHRRHTTHKAPEVQWTNMQAIKCRAARMQAGVRQNPQSHIDDRNPTLKHNIRKALEPKGVRNQKLIN